MGAASQTSLGKGAQGYGYELELGEAEVDYLAG